MSNNERQVIWKFPFRAVDVALVEMPQSAKLLHVAESNDLAHGDLCVWALVYPELPKKVRRIRIYGTGQPCELAEQHENYVGTVAMGMFIWHVFDGGEVPR